MLATPQPSDRIDPDADLIPGLQAGDERALAALMDRRMGVVHGLATRLLGDAVMAEDVAQTVFLKTWQMAPRWTPGQARLLTWMSRVATHACLDILKKKGPIYSDAVPDIADARDGAVSHLVQSDRKDSVKAAIDVLPDNQRAALVLSYYQGLSQKEACAILDVSEKAYESLLSRARKTLRDTLDRSLLETP